jgi:hypothetical protein
MTLLLLNLVQELEDSLASRDISQKELIPLLLDRHGLFIVLA